MKTSEIKKGDVLHICENRGRVIRPIGLQLRVTATGLNMAKYEFSKPRLIGIEGELLDKNGEPLLTDGKPRVRKYSSRMLMSAADAEAYFEEREQANHEFQRREWIVEGAENEALEILKSFGIEGDGIYIDYKYNVEDGTAHPDTLTLRREQVTMLLFKLMDGRV
jgi:hypothetical protein